MKKLILVILALVCVLILAAQNRIEPARSQDEDNNPDLSSNLEINQKIGLVLSGGGARGLAHIGVLKVIDEMQIPIDCIAGTSSGAVIGGLYAMGYSAVEIEAIFLKMKWEDIFDEKIDRQDTYVGNKRWKPYANFFFDIEKNFLPKLPQAFLSGNNLINIFFDQTYDVCHIRDFDKLAIPFRCSATNILNGEQKIFSSGSLHEALRASMSFPSVLQPFKYKGQMLIDGGIINNLPAEIARKMGAEFIIGVQANSGLKTESELETLIDVLDQTVNLGITKNVVNSRNLCDILITPDLEGMTNLDFDKREEIIALGEIAARDYFNSHDFNFPERKPLNKIDKLPDLISFSRIKVEGNLYLSDAKIREYVGLSVNQAYSKKDILEAFHEAYNFDLFSFIYPTIEKVNDSYILIIKLLERKRSRYGLDVSYNEDNDIAVGITLEMNNVLQKNSKMLLNLQVGDSKELNLDYVKNFGKHWGVYFHVFPYLKEYKLYYFNDEHEKTNSVRSLEYGGTFGVGFFARNAMIAEFYSYSFHSQLYQDVASFDERHTISTGFGVKLLREDLDDYVFPMQGSEVFMKYSEAKKDFYSDFNNRTFFAKFRFIFPFTDRFSLKYKFEYGSHFENKANDYDPFYIGGMDNFMGLNPKEKIAPIYKINTIAGRVKLGENFFVDLQFNLLNLGNVDYWQPAKFLYKAAGVKLGYRSFLGPIQIGAALDEDYRSYYYFSLGYEFDQFEFSRR
ncbi:MAG: patatin-like phospholipase family protein [Candidatus Cloacimonadales bacterium]|nr:patatin-like phospholipase family protein [Candidatus Cloacimonadales bacterium]